jgi:general stress protein 26
MKLRKKREIDMAIDITEKASALVSRCMIGILANVNGDGDPNQKAMIKTSADDMNEIWFCSNTSSKRAKQLKIDSKACLYFFDEKTFEGVMLSGKAFVVYDNKKRKEFWRDGMEYYYPLGCTDPDYALIRFVSHSGNYYHGLVNTDFNIG